MLGYALKTRGYRIWLPNERKVVESINVSFNEDNVLEPISNGAMLGFKRKSYNVISNSDTETEEETEHQRSPKISKPESSEQEGASNNSNSSVKVIWEWKAVPRKDKSRTDIYYYEKGSKDRLHCLKDIEAYCRKHNLECVKSLFDFSGKNKYSNYVNMEESNLSD
ncbi:retrovirus-related Pol polyprotein from transposon TNT 1-94 [Trichonephila clavata]|uniref:Retrovirus-related Pol polyprotein from transposon TNT 1-94 n=1 Tax=Trichonephila clavata TaxID=2740835 RepID=A0A8X6JC53_TRICU|nr:retrovirus-related Pol polyprotein from transposon TNT 1-94 [Trichonephila clavata]